jgi:hypothetical protein
MLKFIDVTITSTNGCIVHIIGDVEWTLIPPAITDFHGSVTISGGISCPVGTMNFRIAKPESGYNRDIIAKFDKKDIRKISSIKWTGKDKGVIDLLSKKNVNQQICKAIKKEANKKINVK